MNDHDMLCHAVVALATTELVLRGGTTVDLAPHTGHDPDTGRFARQAAEVRVDGVNGTLLFAIAMTAIVAAVC